MWFFFKITFAFIFVFFGMAADDKAGIVDNWAAAEISAKFMRNPAIRIYRVDVSFNEGVVTLSGTVNTEEARREAEQTCAGLEPRAEPGVLRDHGSPSRGRE